MLNHDTKKVLIGLGSNLEGPRQQVLSAIGAIKSIEGIHFIANSSLYESSPQGPQDQENFYNAVVLVSTNIPANILLVKLQKIENQFGRIKTRYWGERVIDLDILFYGQDTIQSASPDLTIPHAHALTRDFVIVPALEIAPQWQLPDGSYLKDHQTACLNHQLVKI